MIDTIIDIRSKINFYNKIYRVKYFENIKYKTIVFKIICMSCTYFKYYNIKASNNKKIILLLNIKYLIIMSTIFTSFS